MLKIESRNHKQIDIDQKYNITNPNAKRFLETLTTKAKTLKTNLTHINDDD